MWWDRWVTSLQHGKFLLTKHSIKVDKNGELTGDNVAYIYPDYRSVTLRIADELQIYVSELLWLESSPEGRWRLAARQG